VAEAARRATNAWLPAGSGPLPGAGIGKAYATNRFGDQGFHLNSAMDTRVNPRSTVVCRGPRGLSLLDPVVRQGAAPGADSESDRGPFDVTLRALAEALRDELSAQHATIWALSPDSIPPGSREGSALVSVCSTVMTGRPRPGEQISIGPDSLLAHVLRTRRPHSTTAADPDAAALSVEQEGLSQATEIHLVPLTIAALEPAAQSAARGALALAVVQRRPGPRCEPLGEETLLHSACLAGQWLDRAIWLEHDRILLNVGEAFEALQRDSFEALGALARSLADALGFEACTILTADETRRALQVAGTTGIETSMPPRKMEYPYGFSCIGWLAEHRTSLALEDYRAFPQHDGPKYPDRVASPDCYQYLAVPLMVGAELLGAIRMRNVRCAEGAAGTARRRLNVLDRLRLERAGRLLAGVAALLVRQRQVTATLARVRHDLDMPATAIRDGAGLMLREPDDYFNTQLAGVRRKLEDIESFAEILLLNSEMMSLREQPDTPLRPENVLLLGGMVAKLCKMLTPAARRRGLSGILYNQGSFFSIPSLWVDPRLFQIALYNVLQNALKYSDPGTWISVEGEPARIDNETWYQIHVKNTGLGVASEERERIFERHFRSARARRRSDSGLGIGLPTARALLERHGGRLVLTRQHEPTVFTLQLPGYLASRRPS
jgi:signal transduction histidine kinase